MTSPTDKTSLRIFNLPLRGGLWLPLTLGVVLMGGCDAQNRAKSPDALYIKGGYVQAPKISTVTRLPNGMTRVTGWAVPDGRVRLTSDQDRAIGVGADGQGQFQIDVSATSEGHLYELAMEDNGRLMLAEGRLFVPSTGAGHAVLLRSGASSQPLSADAPLISVVDVDRAGAIAVSGRALAGTDVAISTNGQPLVNGRADAKGIYSVMLPMIHDRPVARLNLTASSGNNTQTIELRFDGEHKPVGSVNPVVVSREGDAWRVAWSLPGGGAQLSFVY